ncbi:MAG: hypothetical protein DRP83_07325 [Planctomycetota bacterium]|nr:MAG: hypothetical protein DRP83_07325 [Planctomycetota bacterium]
MAVELGTVAPVGFENFASPRWASLMRSLGCTTAQVYRNRDGNDASHSGVVTIGQIREYLDLAQLPCDSLHAFYGNDLDISVPNDQARQVAVEVMQDEGRLALALGGPIVVVHCSGIFPENLTPEEHRVRRSCLRQSIDELGRFGQANGVRYAFENLPPYHAIGSDVAELAEILREVDSPAAGMCFDIAHANLAGNPVEAIAQAGERIIYTHVCDNLGRVDDHLLPFTGQIDFQAAADALREVRYDGVLMIETFCDVDELAKLVDQGIGEKISQFLARVRG